MTLSPGIQAALRVFKDALAARFGARVRDVVLFGSHARSQAHEESDVDVLVVVEGLSHRERGEVFELGAEVWMDTKVRIAPCALSSHEASELRRLERQLIVDVDHEGVRL